MALTKDLYRELEDIVGPENIRVQINHILPSSCVLVTGRAAVIFTSLLSIGSHRATVNFHQLGSAFLLHGDGSIIYMPVFIVLSTYFSNIHTIRR